MTDLLMSGDKTSPDSLATEKNLARLRLQLTEADSNKDIEKLRDQIFLAEQFRSVTPDVSILKAREHQVITSGLSRSKHYQTPRSVVGATEANPCSLNNSIRASTAAPGHPQ
jgi:hypothetical protein